MNTLIEKMKRVELKVASKYGAFELFALFQPDTTLRLWDILIAAEWIEKDELGSMRIIAAHMNQEFSVAEMVEFSGFVVIPHDYDGLHKFHAQVEVQHGSQEFRNVTFFDAPILHAYVITSSKTRHKCLH